MPTPDEVDHWLKTGSAEPQIERIEGVPLLNLSWGHVLLLMDLCLTELYAMRINDAATPLTKSLATEAARMTILASRERWDFATREAMLEQLIDAFNGAL